MAQVYDRINGKKLEKLIALQEDVQLALDVEVLEALGRAQENLARHRETGNAKVGIEEGHVDRYLYLEDPEAKDSVGAAMSIELGHMQNSRLGRKKVKGLYIISDAAKIPRRGR